MQINSFLANPKHFRKENPRMILKEHLIVVMQVLSSGRILHKYESLSHPVNVKLVRLTPLRDFSVLYQLIIV